MKTNILGGAYTAKSVNAADNRLINLFPEAVPEGGKEPGYLQRCPGLRFRGTAGTGPVRGMWQFNGYGYLVSGTELYRIGVSFEHTLIGQVSGSGPVSMSDNGTQMFISCNPRAYIYDGETLQEITDEDFPGSVTVGYLDGFFVFNEPNSQKIWVTALLDGTQIDALDFASAEGAPDGVVSLFVDHRELWIFGTNTIEVWYNAGTQDFPFSRIQGGFLEIGCAAAYSPARLDNSLFWLGQDDRGYGVVYRANGYTGVRVSTHAVEYAIQSYGDISDAIGYSYQQNGHTFYVLTFPTADKTWCFDAATNEWHERAGFSGGEFTRHQSNCQMFLNNEVIVGSYNSGDYYAFDVDVYSDNGAIQKWLRSWRALGPGQNNLKRSAQHMLQLDCQAGVGLVSGQGSDPQAVLRWSDDGGHNWSNEHTAPMGKIGETGRRTIWRRLGMTTRLRDRVYEVSGTDPVKVAIMGAELMISPTNS